MTIKHVLFENDIRVEPGSFRDRNGRVFYYDDQVFRYLSQGAFDNWEYLAKTRFFQRHHEAGNIVQTEWVTAPHRLEPSEAEGWAGILRHERIPVISYPYEWSFGMLKDAAFLQLELLLDALAEGMMIKDSSAFNIQWHGTKPVFIDVPSFEVYRAGDPWVGYRQFCQMFLYPLMLQAYKGIPFQPWLRGDIEGIEPAWMSAIFSPWEWLKPGVITHVVAHSKLQAAAAHSTTDVKGSIRQAGFNTELIKANIKGLQRILARIQWQCKGSQWSDYTTNHSYTDEEMAAKQAFVERVTQSRRWGQVWDLGCNTGTFSRIAARHADYVLAMDADALAIERLYQVLKAENNRTILPLVMNIAQPSPSLGWQGQERKVLSERGTPDLILALALIHHLVISANIPVSDLVAWLASLESALVIEFVTKDDPMTQRLLQNKVDQYTDYTVDYFEQCLQRFFHIRERQVLASGTRVLYYAEVL